MATKKAKTTKRNKIDWKLFFKLIQAGTSNEKIAERMGVRIDTKSADPYKPIRAMKSRAKTVGINIDGQLTKLRVGKVKNAAPKPKAAKPKAAAPKPETLAATA